jgi:hypothetical protein
LHLTRLWQEEVGGPADTGGPLGPIQPVVLSAAVFDDRGLRRSVVLSISWNALTGFAWLPAVPRDWGAVANIVIPVAGVGTLRKVR